MLQCFLPRTSRKPGAAGYRGPGAWTNVLAPPCHPCLGYFGLCCFIDFICLSFALPHHSTVTPNLTTNKTPKISPDPTQPFDHKTAFPRPSHSPSPTCPRRAIAPSRLPARPRPPGSSRIRVLGCNYSKNVTAPLPAYLPQIAQPAPTEFFDHRPVLPRFLSARRKRVELVS